VIRPGEPWGEPTSAPPDVEVTGGDPALAAAAASAPGALIRFVPDATSDLARAVGLRAGAPRPGGGMALPVDALALDNELSLSVGDGLSLSVGDGLSLSAGDGFLACNMCVLGTPPDRLRWSSPAPEVEVLLDGTPWFAGPASAVVIANGQFLRGHDLVPRGHPGDGKAEVQVYELRRGERRSMRRRLPTGAHLPHPRIRSRTATTVEVRGSGLLAVEADGETRPPTSGLRIRVVTPAFRLLL
jgi:YegS C-terminal NAD kinase beta sandwich-like domain